MSHNANIIRDRKTMASRIYTKMIKVLNKTELEHFDICKQYINELIIEKEIKDQRRTK